jgi:N-acetylglucosaminyl-diphospho-decaprenol L-rhamnosyltransferase
MISVVIVTWNSAAHIARCLASLPAQDVEIVVIDNASSDGTAAEVRRFPRVKLIASTTNLGFAAACNLGAKQSGGEILLFLNADTQLQSSLVPFEELFRKRSSCVAAGAKLIDTEGRPQAGFLVRSFPTTTSLLFEILLINRLLPNNPVNLRYRCWAFDADEPAEVDQPAGAALAVRRKAFNEVGGFDERFYPLWFEDVDLCLRLKRAGGVIRYEPEVVFTHQGGHSLQALDYSDKQVYWYRNLIYYVRKNLGWWASVVIRAGLLLGLSLRALAEVANLDTGRNRESSSSRPRTQPRVRNARTAAYWRALSVVFEGCPRRRTP